MKLSLVDALKQRRLEEFARQTCLEGYASDRDKAFGRSLGLIMRTAPRKAGSL